jgi:hypothetical protein
LNREGFKDYLTTIYKGIKSDKQLSRKAVSDLLSRSKRIELELNVNLDDFISHNTDMNQIREYIKDKSKLIHYNGSKPYFYNQYVSTAKMYLFYKIYIAKPSIRS